MRDLIVIFGTLAFFAICVAYVGLCDRIIGPDPNPADEPDYVEPERAVR